MLKKETVVNTIRMEKGDAVHTFLTSTKYQAFLHGANCQAAMNSGIARTVRERLPELFRMDLEFDKIVSPEGKLGDISYVTYSSEEKNVSHKIAFNMYTQLYYGRSKRHFNYGAFVRSLGHVVDTLKELHYNDMEAVNIIMPRIGCGLGGGDWSIVNEILLHYPCDDINMVFNVFDL